MDHRWAAFQAPVKRGGWPFYGPDEIEAVRAVLASGRVNYWTGEECRAFEREYAQQLGCRHAVAVMNGTVALEGALLALDIGPGDEVVVTPRTFIASASVVMLRGARPVFADIDPESQNISAETIRPLLTEKTKAIIVVHLAGWPCEMDPIMELARSRGIKVVEDCAQAHGAVYHGRPVGSIGDVAAFSFCQDKIISTGGEGGLVVTNDPEIARRVWSFKDHGKNRELIAKPHDGLGFRWLHDSLGSNWRMTEMQAAIGRCQLRKLGDWVAARRRNAAILDQALGDLPSLEVPRVPPGIEPAYYKYYAFVRPEGLRSGWDRDRLQAAINAAGVPCFVGSCSEVYLEKAFAAPGLQPETPLPNARRLGEISLMFQVHPTLTAADMARTAAVVREVVAGATIF
ncbi:DegT/DnrJ/EryC1/StrS family aminotransferase [Desulfurivibrio sp. D14AmB]|uniref:DegT/DnrJ/EryC1/StrS family aminotransferase n=1 Tax=Desulfurivibrio sp. D14AmB TaxID=3374370 RepID=UPI00376EA25A